MLAAKHVSRINIINILLIYRCVCSKLNSGLIMIQFSDSAMHSSDDNAKIPDDVAAKAQKVFH